MPPSVRPHHLLPLPYLLGFWSLIILLSLSSGPASYAEWRSLNYTEGNQGYILYVDPGTVRRNGDLVKMWVLYDFRAVQTIEATSYLSAVWHQQFDCAKERSRHLAYTYFSGNMGRGDVVFTGDDEGNKWSQASPNSVGLLLWDIVCIR
jgi:hypothetical protein